jgi:NitT/TauT family transport system substrate-binding protein
MVKRRDALGLMGAAAFAFPSVARADTSQKLRVGYSASGESLAQGLYTQEGGFFAKAGLNVELIEVSNGGAMTAALVSGAIDVGPSNVASMAAAYAHGLRLNLFAPSVIISSDAPPTTIIAVQNASPIRAARDFSGKTIACNTLRDLQQAAVMSWLDKNGGDSKSVRFVELPNPDQLGALAAHRVDAACLVEPFLSSAKNEARFIGRPYDSLGRLLMTFGWIANTGWYAANPDSVKKLVPALRESAGWANKNPAQTAAINSAHSKVPVEQLTSQNRQLFAESKLDARLIQPIIDASARYGFLPHGFAASELFAPNVV